MTGAPNETVARQWADEWAIKRGFMSIEHFQRESYVTASVKLYGKNNYLTFPSLRAPHKDQP